MNPLGPQTNLTKEEQMACHYDDLTQILGNCTKYCLTSPLIHVDSDLKEIVISATFRLGFL